MVEETLMQPYSTRICSLSEIKTPSQNQVDFTRILFLKNTGEKSCINVKMCHFNIFWNGTFWFFILKWLCLGVFIVYDIIQNKKVKTETKQYFPTQNILRGLKLYFFHNFPSHRILKLSIVMEFRLKADFKSFAKQNFHPLMKWTQL